MDVNNDGFFQKLKKDEPVACRACDGSGRMVRDPDIGTDQECFVCEGLGVFEDTTPPQRTWVKLTNEQYLEACKIAEGGNYMVAFQRIQQWLMENNA
jgi:DnaJ-class molecular chaperone